MIAIRADGVALVIAPAPVVCERCKRAAMLLAVRVDAVTCLPCDPIPDSLEPR